MKAGWEVRPLGEVCEVLDSQRKPITKRDRLPGPYPYFGATGELDQVAEYIFDEPLVLLGEDGAKWGAGERSAFRISGKVWVNNHAHVIRPARSRLDDDWLVYYLNFSDLFEFITGLTVPKLNQGRMREIPVPLPPLEEQKRIVAVLDEAFEDLDRARANAEANLADARALFGALTAGAFNQDAAGWSEASLGELASFRNGLNFTRTSKGQSIKIVGVGDFQSNQRVPVDALSEVMINGALADEDRLHSGDILTVRSNGNKALIGRVMMLPETDEIISFSGFTIRIRLTSAAVLPEYLLQFLRTPHVRETLTSGGGGSNISNLNQGQLSRLRIRFPDIDQQREILDQIAAIAEAAEELMNKFQERSRDLSTLRQSLLQKAFSGALS